MGSVGFVRDGWCGTGPYVAALYRETTIVYCLRVTETSRTPSRGGNKEQKLWADLLDKR